MRKKLNENYAKRILEAAERTWEKNKAKMEAKGIDKNSYMLGYLHGYQTCYDTYDLDNIGEILEGLKKKGE